MPEVAGAEPPIPTQASKARISAFAENLASRLGFSPGDVLEPLVARLGGQILYRNPAALPGRRAPESIRVYSDRAFVIYLPSTTSVERDRFTVAHELGHLFLHFPMVLRSRPGACMVATRWVDESDKVQQRAEWEANWFAAAFLMPSEPFESAFRKKGGNLSKVASLFRVSGRAAEVRAINLNLL